MKQKSTVLIILAVLALLLGAAGDGYTLGGGFWGGGGAAHTLLDWEVLEGESWREQTPDIGPYAGQTVTFIFEQGDNDVGVGEHRYVDNVTLCQQAEPMPTIANGPTSASCVRTAVTYLPVIVH